jgi:hypothetical protein
MAISDSQVRVFALILDIVATIILTLHVIIIHGKLRVEHGHGDTDDPQSEVVVNDSEDVERGFLIGAIVIYLFTFMLFIWAEIQSRNQVVRRWAMLEKHLGINLREVENVPLGDKEDVTIKRSQKNTFRKFRT